MPHMIRTQRLLLRPPSPRDARSFTRHCDDWDVTRMTARWPARFSEDFARARLSAAGTWDQRHDLLFAVIWQGAAIGLIGLHGAGLPGTASLGYMIGKAAWGQGLMTEAVKAVCRHGFAVMGLDRIRADRYADNPASGRVLEKAGFCCIGPDIPVFSEARGRADGGWSYALTRERLNP